VGALH